MGCKLSRDAAVWLRGKREDNPSLPGTNLRFRIDPARSNNAMFALSAVTFASYDEISSNFVLSALDFCSQTGKKKNQDDGDMLKE